MKVGLIHSEEEYAAAMTRLCALMDSDPAAGSEEEAELELLALVIKDYERGIVPDGNPTRAGIRHSC